MGNRTGQKPLELIQYSSTGACLLKFENGCNHAGHAPASRSKSTEACTQVELIGIAQFLQDSQSQLTVSGLMQIAERMQAGNVAAFFRNNHFNTIYKHTDGALYVLVTDEGYSHEEGVVWERLCSEIGDTTYVSAEFEPYGVFQQKQVAEQEEALRQIRLAEEVRSDGLYCSISLCHPLNSDPVNMNRAERSQCHYASS